MTRYHIALYVLMSALMVLSGAVAFRISLNYYRKTEKVVRLVGAGRAGSGGNTGTNGSFCRKR